MILLDCGNRNLKAQFFDLEQDPDELINFYEDATKADQVVKLAEMMAAYGPAHQEPSLRHPKMVADLAEAQAKK